VSTVVLTPTSYLVLGCLAVGGPATPYELKQFVAKGVGYFWSFPHSQLYSEPARLCAAGLLGEQREKGGRRRRLFSITKAGRRALAEWLEDPTVELPEIRDVGLLKLFFGQLVTQEDVVVLARHQRDAHQQRLGLYELLATDRPPGPAGFPVELGLAYERAAVAFWDSIAETPPPR
jgi:PadR family transcriptional regulator, regulatory protein AphA